MDIYLQPTEVIDADHESIRATAEDLIRGCTDNRERAVNLFYFVRDSIRYQVPPHIYEKLGVNVFPRHGYNQFYIGDRWVSAAATFDKTLCDRNGLPAVQFDGTTDAVLPEQDLQGHPYIEYMERFPPSADLPFDWIAKRVSRIVGPDKRPWLKPEDQRNGP